MHKSYDASNKDFNFVNGKTRMGFPVIMWILKRNKPISHLHIEIIYLKRDKEIENNTLTPV